MKLDEYLAQPGQTGVGFAKKLGVSQPTLSDWARGKDRGGKEIPLERCDQIERESLGAVTCEEMRPDKVAYFAYMRTRPEPEMQGQVVLTAGDAMGYDAIEKEA